MTSSLLPAMLAEIPVSFYDGLLPLGGLLILLSIIVPLAAAFALLVSGSLPDRFVRGFAVFAAAVPAVCAIVLACAYLRSGEGSAYLFYLDSSTGLDAYGISLKLGLNGVSMPLFLLAGIVGLAATLYAAQQEVERQRTYLILLLVMVGGLMGVFASVDLLFYYFFHEVALIPTFVMMAIWGGKGRRSAAMELAIYLTLGAMLSLAGIIALVKMSGADSFSLVELRMHFEALSLAEGLQRSLYGILLIGFGILVSLWPFHSWAPRGYGAAPTPVAMLHAGVLKKFGLYGLLQIAGPMLPQGAAHWVPLLCWLALGNILVIGLVTIAQRDLKQMLGYSSVMHMGYLFLAIAAATTLGSGAAVLLMFAHGLSTALLFLLANCVQVRTGTLDLQSMGGLAGRAPVLAGFFVAATMAGIGLPGFANFWGEFLVFLSLHEQDSTRWLTAPAVAGIVISAIYGLRAVSRIFYGEETPAFQAEAAVRAPRDMTGSERLPAVLLLLALLAVGLFPRLITGPLDRALSEPIPRAEALSAGLPAAPADVVVAGNP